METLLVVVVVAAAALWAARRLRRTVRGATHGAAACPGCAAAASCTGSRPAQAGSSNRFCPSSERMPATSCTVSRQPR
jgi:hypothetical protein